MTVLHSGSTKKFSANWENVFGGKKKSAGKTLAAKKPAKKAARKKAAKK